MKSPTRLCLLLLVGCLAACAGTPLEELRVSVREGDGEAACLASDTRETPACHDEEVQTWIDADGVCLMTSCVLQRAPAGWSGPNPESCKPDGLAELPRCEDAG